MSESGEVNAEESGGSIESKADSLPAVIEAPAPTIAASDDNAGEAVVPLPPPPAADDSAGLHHFLVVLLNFD